ncbi:MAG: MobA/MobL family protein [Leptolyngbya sp. SIO4C1]|nr:MobA/MobL family protein [Leptolyngbya sp. SIO4C1]
MAAAAVAAVGYYRCAVRPMGRSTGASATAAAAYRAGERIYDERTGLTHDYQKRTGVKATELIAPAEVTWISERSQLWNAAEQAERKSNARIAREVIACFPHQLSEEEQRRTARELGQWLAKEYNVAVDIAWHEPDKKGDQRNHHAHLLFTTRTVTAEGLGKKTRILDDKVTGPQEVTKIRERWALILNAGLERSGLEIRVNHRSYKDQGLDIKPGIHMGRQATNLERQGMFTEVGELNREIQADNDNIVDLTQQIAALKRQLAAEQEAVQREDVRSVMATSKEMAQQTYRDRTRTAVERQLKGMGAERYDIGILQPPDANGRRRMLRRFWTAEQLLVRDPLTQDVPKLSWLKNQNRNGADIYVRPDPRDGRNSGLILIDDLEGIGWEKRLAADGLKPAVVTLTSDGNNQAWVRVSEQPLNAETATEVARLLAERYGGDPASADFMHYGRLAGFTNQKPQHIRKDGQQPFVLLEKYNGRLAEQGAAIVQQAEAQVAANRKALARLDRAGAIVVPEEAPSERASQLRDWFERQWPEFAERYGNDESRVDFRMCQAAQRRGHTDLDVAWALRYGSPNLEARKAGHVEDYCDRTVRKARLWLESQRTASEDTGAAARRAAGKGQAVPADKSERSQQPIANEDQRDLIEQMLHWQRIAETERDRLRPRSASQDDLTDWGLSQTTLQVLQTYDGHQAEQERERRIDAALNADSQNEDTPLKTYRTGLKERLLQKGRGYYRYADRWLAERLAKRGYTRLQARRAIAQASPELMEETPMRRVSFIRRIVDRVYKRYEQHQTRVQVKKRLPSDKAAAKPAPVRSPSTEQRSTPKTPIDRPEAPPKAQGPPSERQNTKAQFGKYSAFEVRHDLARGYQPRYRPSFDEGNANITLDNPNHGEVGIAELDGDLVAVLKQAARQSDNSRFKLKQAHRMRHDQDAEHSDFWEKRGGYYGSAKREYAKELSRQAEVKGEEAVLSPETDADIAVRLRIAGYSWNSINKAVAEHSPVAAALPTPEHQAKYLEMLVIPTLKAPGVRQAKEAKCLVPRCEGMDQR